MRAIMLLSEATDLEASWPAREALAVDLRAERMSLFSLSTFLWTVLKFFRVTSCGSRRRGWSCVKGSSH